MNRPAPHAQPPIGPIGPMGPSGPMGPDDPRLTAYALDALDAADRAAVEAALAADLALRALVDETRAAAATLSAALPRDGASLTALQRQAILLRGTARPARLRRWTPFMLGSSAAAVVLLAIGLRATTVERRAVTLSAAPRSGADGAIVGGYMAGGPNASELRARYDSLRAAHAAATRAAQMSSTDAATPGLQKQLAKIQQDLADTTSKLQAEAAAAQQALDAARIQNLLELNLGDASQSLDPRLAEVLRRSRENQPASAPAAEIFEYRGFKIDPSRVNVVPGRSGEAVKIVAARGAFPARAGNGAPAGGPAPAGPVAHDTVEECTDVAAPRTHWEKVGDGWALVTEPESAGGEAYVLVEESPFLRVADARLSTFSIDVDTASYANVRRMLTAGQRPPADAVRVEELLNYFPYEYPAPSGTDPFAVHLEVAECPWEVSHRLVRVGIQGRAMERKARPPMNLVFLVDVSGSMNAPNKLPLVQASLRMLLEELNERDSVAIVVYAGASGLALPPTWCEQKAEIQRVIDDLRPGGSTNGAAGIELAYEIATQRFVKDGVNRVVLATDGDFNVGVTSQEALHALITTKAKSGVFLTCLGFGMGNLKDATLELLADKGNGNYGYIDSTREARKVLVDEASGTLVTIAKDVKLQVEFNPATVASYRLIGYDNRRLADRDFADDTKDAGEVGAGHRVTALYEVVPVGAPDAAAVAPTTEEPLRYGAKPAPVAAPAGPMAPEGDLAKELLTVKVRWKEPAGTVSTKREFPLVDGGASYGKASRDFQFAASVVGFGMKLRGSPYAAKLTWEAIAEWASSGLAFDPGGYRAEFADLVAKAKALPR
ncbi:MAG: VWA domain-containing protein [Planctomycetia bacterium]|nr:VWA domain-containing protein [Planctomycetia bacterium]